MSYASPEKTPRELTTFGIILLISGFILLGAVIMLVLHAKQAMARTADQAAQRITAASASPPPPASAPAAAAVPTVALSPAALAGRDLMGKSDCAACHQPAAKLVGPSFQQIAEKYQKDAAALPRLVQKVKQGGAGVWGQIPMTPHPALADTDIEKMVAYVLTFVPGQAAPPAAPVDFSGMITDQPLRPAHTAEHLLQPDPHAAYWAGVTPQDIQLTAQPMTTPAPKHTATPVIHVQALHNGERIAFRLRWADPELSVAGRLATFSDAVAMQFPVKAEDNPPPIAMGSKDQPVHVYHWRHQYQVDKEHGMVSMRELYPNMQVDIYPLEFAYAGNLAPISAQERETFALGQAVGNPQSFRKARGIDELVAAGFGSSTVIENVTAQATGYWADGSWTVVIVRPLATRSGSTLTVGKRTFMGFAAWQGGEQEVGSRKSVTIKWTPLELQPAP
jgi:cytochrome c551/c552